MKKRVIRLTESDIERLVTKIIKEEGNDTAISGSDLGQKDNEWAICTKSVGYKTKSGKYKIHPDKQDEFERCKKKVKKQFTESKLNEIGGYDSPELGRSHGQSTMESIRDTYEVIVDSVEHLNSLKYDILDDRLSRATKKLLSVVGPALNEYSRVWIDAEKRRQGGLR